MVTVAILSLLHYFLMVVTMYSILAFGDSTIFSQILSDRGNEKAVACLWWYSDLILYMK